MKSNIHIVSTRSLKADNQKKMESADFQLTQWDFIQKKISIPPTIKEFHFTKNIVLTSATSVKAWAEIKKQVSADLSGCKIYCLEHATKTSAQEFGLSIADTAPNASILADSILKDKTVKEITFICSNKRLSDLPNKLSEGGVTVHEIEAYKTELTSKKIDDKIDSVLFFSPSAIESFLVENAPLETCFCVGSTTARYAEKSGFINTIISDFTSEESVVQKLIDHYTIQHS